MLPITKKSGFLDLCSDDQAIVLRFMCFHLVALYFYRSSDVFVFHHMPLIVSKPFLKEISSKHHLII